VAVALVVLGACWFGLFGVVVVGVGVWGGLVAIHSGKYTHAPLPDAALGSRRLDVASMYNTERLRPRYDSRLGMPLLLGRALED
jgi:6-phosphofructokinase 1